jgi:hypothetical protein
MISTTSCVADRFSHPGEYSREEFFYFLGKGFIIIIIIIVVRYLDATDESGGVGRFQSAENDFGRHQTGQFGIDGHGFLIESVVGVEPEFTLHPFEFSPVPFAIVERLRIG